MPQHVHPLLFDSVLNGDDRIDATSGTDKPTNEPKSGKNRMQVDIETRAVDDKVARLEGLGAYRIVVGAVDEQGNRWVAMADPERQRVLRLRQRPERATGQ